MRDYGTAGITLLCSPGLAGTDRTHRRELVPSGVSENRRRPDRVGTRWPHFKGSGLAFEARGKRLPQSVEAGPSPETSRAIGGRCCPHYKILLTSTPAEPGSTNPISSPVRSGKAETSHGTGGLVS